MMKIVIISAYQNKFLGYSNLKNEYQFPQYIAIQQNSNKWWKLRIEKNNYLVPVIQWLNLYIKAIFQQEFPFFLTQFEFYLRNTDTQIDSRCLWQQQNNFLSSLGLPLIGNITVNNFRTWRSQFDYRGVF